LNVLSVEEERFHFGMWAINKSPLMLGGILDSKLSKTSLAIMSNKEVLAINQDPLGKQAQLVRRYTVEEWDIWMGDLSGSRKVIGIANWRNQSKSVSVDLASLGISSTAARDVWAAKDAGTLSGTQTVNLAAHELKLWVLSNITTANTPSSTYYQAASAKLTGGSSVTTCSSGDCLPTGKKVGNIGSGSTVTFSAKAKSTKALVGVDFINYDYAFTTAWDWGSNTRNMTIAVNGGSAKRWAFPLSGEDWYQTGRLTVELDGLKNGSNSIVFANVGTAYTPDLVGIEIFD
jgi:alpha-galactosidase